MRRRARSYLTAIQAFAVRMPSRLRASIAAARENAFRPGDEIDATNSRCSAQALAPAIAWPGEGWTGQFVFDEVFCFHDTPQSV